MRILFVEDVPAEAELIVRHLRRDGVVLQWHRVASESTLREAVPQFQPTIVLSDFSLPGFNGLSALQVVREIAPELPFMFVSGTIGEERAIEALRCGAVDYVLKTNMARLTPAVTRALAEARAGQERRRQEAQITRLTRVLRMLSGINGVVVRIRERQELLEEACRLAVRVGGYAAALVMLQQGSSRAPLPIARAGLDAAATESLAAMAQMSATRDDGVVHGVLQNGSVFFSNDLAGVDTDERMRSLIERAAFGSAVVLPLLLDDTAIGALVLASRSAGSVGEEELQMLREVAANLSFALQYLHRDSTVQFLSYFDPLTGLAKRSLFCERLQRAISVPRRTDCVIAVADVEKLSVINDSIGRHAGDRLLQLVADRLRRCFVDTECLAQFGGGTFAVALDAGAGGTSASSVVGAADRQHPEGGAVEDIQARLAQVFGQPFELDGRAIPVAVKCGLALYPADGQEAETLVQNAEAALRNAKSSDQRCLLYNFEQRAAVVERLQLEHRLRHALEREQFELHYQPKIDLSSGCVGGVEALIRWRHPETGLLAPAAFLQLLESTGLILPVGDWVIRQASEDARRWRQAGTPLGRIAVNISPLQLRRRGFAQSFLDLCERWSGERTALDIEITEGALLGESAAEIAELQRLREAGMRIAIDDFGTGYSSLSRLADLPIDTLKIDRSFVQRLSPAGAARTIVTTIVTLAHAFGMTVIAEGVETETQLAALRELGCDQVQGYLFSRPLPEATLLERLGRDGRLER